MSRIFTLNSPLGDDLLFKSLKGAEQLSENFEWELTALSTDKFIQGKELLGKSVTIVIETAGEAPRFLNAQVTQFQKTGQEERYATYEAILRPWFWYATLTSDCKIFQHKSVVQIADEVFADYPFTVKKKLSGTYHEIGYCVQYNESDFHFLSRLFEQEGIYYYFEHHDGEHSLVLADFISAHSPLPDYPAIRFAAADRDGAAGEECIHEWKVVEQIRSGRYVTSDYDFKKSQAPLQQTRSQAREHAHADYEVYQWGHGFTDPAHGEHLTRVELERLQQEQIHITGKTNVRGLAPGHTVTLFQHPDEAQNAEYLITRTNYDFLENPYASGDEQPDWNIAFTVQPSTEPFRRLKQTPRPHIAGIHTAKVVGPAGQEIWCDAYGRVKCQFPWDRYGKSDENSSCWIRSVSPWAGSNFGAVSLPRIGQEVLIQYINGDPNRPVIVGRAYNDRQMPPWDLPANATQSGLLSRSSQGGFYGNANAIRFEDKKGEEQVWIQAERNMDTVVENDETHHVMHDRTKTIDHDETVFVHHDRTETVDHDETITVHNDRTETVDHNETITVHNDRKERVDHNETISIGDNRREDVGKNEDVKIGRNRSNTIGGDHDEDIGESHTIKIGHNLTETVTMAATQNVGLAKMTNVGGAYSINVALAMNTLVGLSQTEQVIMNKSGMVGVDYSVKVGKNFRLDAGDTIELVCGASVLKMTKDGKVTINGKEIDLVASTHMGLESKRIDVN